MTDKETETQQDTNAQKDKWLGPERAPVDQNQDHLREQRDWERGLLEKQLTAAVTEQRRARRWGIFFKLLTFAYLTTLLVLVYRPGDWGDGGIASTEPHTALVSISGVIAHDSESSARTVMAGLEDAFEDEGTKGVILRINSPGGSPVQSSEVYDEIRRLRELHPDTPLYAVVTDMCASGGYYIASAADEIYANKSSIVGSIGVITSTFGFVDAMDKLGVERRLVTAGDHKGFLDPFSPLQAEELAHLRGLLDNIHEQFISAVREGRGDRVEENDELFSGLVWTGEQALELGLVDGLASVGEVAREVVGAEKLVDFTTKPDLLERLAKRIGASAGEAMATASGLNRFPLR